MGNGSKSSTSKQDAVGESAAKENSKDVAVEVQAASWWICQADAILICAGAGMSAKPGAGEAVYVSPKDFAAHYPFMLRHGYRSGYEAMGVLFDGKLPDEVKWGFWSKHYTNMRWGFEPCEGYNILHRLLKIATDKEQDYFVQTSNVDGCFERAGFSKERIYGPQGDCGLYQCSGPCSRESIWEAKDLFAKLSASRDEATGAVDKALVPVCPSCGRRVVMNLRSGDYFLHTRSDKANRDFVKWVDDIIASGKRLVIIEVGAGYNTPVVTRFPMEAIAREASRKGQASLIRINPDATALPGDLLEAVSLPFGWEVLSEIEKELAAGLPDAMEAAAKNIKSAREEEFKRPSRRPVVERTTEGRRFDWREMMQNLLR